MVIDLCICGYSLGLKLKLNVHTLVGLKYHAHAVSEAAVAADADPAQEVLAAVRMHQVAVGRLARLVVASGRSSHAMVAAALAEGPTAVAVVGTAGPWTWIAASSSTCSWQGWSSWHWCSVWHEGSWHRCVV